MIYKVTHTTKYRYDQLISICHNLACLEPRDTKNQTCSRFDPQMSPAPAYQTSVTDWFGNSLLWFCFQEGYDELTVTSKSRVEVAPPTIPDPASTPPWEEVARRLSSPDGDASLDASQFLHDSPRVRRHAEMRRYAESSFTRGRPILAAVEELTHRIHEDFEFNDKETSVTTPVEEVFEKRKGVCQDFTHVQLSMLRSMGLAGRYVSGYIRTYPPEGQPRLTGADATHAWVSVWTGDESGWIDTDATNDKFLSQDHITVAWARDYSDIAPLRGVFVGGGRAVLTVSVNVAPAD